MFILYKRPKHCFHPLDQEQLVNTFIIFIIQKYFKPCIRVILESLNDVKVRMHNIEKNIKNTPLNTR